MKNIFKVFWADVRRISSNVVAVVIILGLAIIPSLYAWFNILSNWDPYGPDATSNLKVAVYSCDKGIVEYGFKINVGDNVIEGLKTNTAIGWVFTDSEEEAVDGVYSGDYYAALVIPDNFTEKLVGFLNGDFEHPQIIYYENEKKNAIAPKITGKAKTSVQESVNSSFLSTVTEVLMKFSNMVENTGQSLSLFSGLISNLETIDDELNMYINTMDSFIGLTNAIGSLIDTSIVVIPDLDSMLQTGSDTLGTVEGAIDSGTAAVDTVSGMLDYSFGAVDTSLSQLSQLLQNDIALIESGNEAAMAQLKAIQEALPYVQEIYKTATDQLITSIDSSTSENVNSDQLKDEVNNASNSLDVLTNDVNTIVNSASQGSENLSVLADQITAEVNTCRTQINTVKNDYNNNVKPSLNNSMNSMQSAVNNAENTLNGADVDVSGVSDVLKQFRGVVTTGSNNFAESKERAITLEENLSELIDKLKELEQNENVKKIEEMLLTNPEELADFVSSPVKIKTEAFFPIENYGSAMAPFYTILAIWVGSLILVAIIHVHVVPEPGLERIKSYHAYFGRYILFFLIGQAQALLTVLGNLHYIGIQCVHPFLFWFACSICSLSFTSIIYSLTVAFGNIGEAIAVVIMVIQVAGAGGTFPIEVLPEVYQAIYKFLPFTYGLLAMKETIGGMYKNDYWIYIGVLLIYVAISLVVGLLVAIPFRKMNQKIEHSKEKTELML